MRVPTGVGPSRAVVLAVCLVGASALSACGRDYDAGPPDASPAVVVIEEPDSGPYRGVELERPISKADVQLRDTAGEPFNLARDTTGEVVLVFAGYTHCPDVCPTTMADVSAALRGLTDAQSARVTVAMFSTDPARDTPERLRAFLDQFDPRYIGVLGEEAALIGAINAMGIDVQPPSVAEDGDVLVEHGAQVLAFAPPSDQAALLWTSGTTVDEYRDDLRTLLAATA